MARRKSTQPPHDFSITSDDAAVQGSAPSLAEFLGDLVENTRPDAFAAQVLAASIICAALIQRQSVDTNPDKIQRNAAISVLYVNAIVEELERP